MHSYPRARGRGGRGYVATEPLGPRCGQLPAEKFDGKIERENPPRVARFALYFRALKISRKYGAFPHGGARWMALLSK